MRDWGVVVTGAGSGIGGAMARRFAMAGARVVVNDIDPSVEKIAREIGGFAVLGDAATPEELIDRASACLGEIDLFCANAGVDPEGGPEADEAAWASAWQVNVMAHVRAARALLPRWLARGRGHFLATASAAGLLTSLDSAPYAVTKHGTLAFAEWLSATYGDRGITVQALCPQGVRTPMLVNTGAMGRLLLEPGALSPDEVAQAVVEAIPAGRFLILPHAEVAGFYARRATDTDRWLAGMRRLRRRLVETNGER